MRLSVSDFAESIVLLGRDMMQYVLVPCMHAFSVMSLCMIVKLVELVDHIEMRKTDCFGKTRLVLHVPSSL